MVDAYEPTNEAVCELIGRIGVALDGAEFHDGLDALLVTTCYVFSKVADAETCRGLVGDYCRQLRQQVTLDRMLHRDIDDA